MIECKYILDLCKRFESYLMPFDIHILRQRYNGKIFKSTYMIGREMGISDETVRTYENRALDAISHCLDLEASNQSITPMRYAKSFLQPAASMICQGLMKTASSSTPTLQRGEMIIVASKNGRPHGYSIYPYGAIVGRVLLTDCYRDSTPNPYSHEWRLRFEQPEIFEEPIPYKGHNCYFYINQEIAAQLPPRYEYSFESIQRHEVIDKLTR
jgi:hypothetical protein